MATCRSDGRLPASLFSLIQRPICNHVSCGYCSSGMCATALRSAAKLHTYAHIHTHAVSPAGVSHFTLAHKYPSGTRADCVSPATRQRRVSPRARSLVVVFKETACFAFKNKSSSQELVRTHLSPRHWETWKSKTCPAGLSQARCARSLLLTVCLPSSDNFTLAYVKDKCIFNYVHYGGRFYFFKDIPQILSSNKRVESL